MKRAVWMYYQGLLPEYPSRPPPVAKPADEDEKQVKRLCAVVKGDAYVNIKLSLVLFNIYLSKKK